MEVIRNEDLRYLLENKNEPSVTMYLPTAPGDKDKNRIMIKNALSKVKDQLNEKGYDAQKIAGSVAQFTELSDSLEFLNAQSAGLAVFINNEGIKTFRLPHEFENEVMVDSIFHIKPLLPLLTENSGFFVLSISKNRLKLYEADRFEIKNVEIAGMPTDMDSTLQYDIDETHFSRVPQNASSAKGSTSTHGHGIGDETEKEFTLRYCQMVEKYISPYVNGKNKPMVIAAVDYIQSIYKDASSFKDITEKGISGNPDMMTEEELRKQAWDIIRPMLDKYSDEAKNIYGNLSNTERASASISPIVKAASFSRIDTLFLSRSAEEIIGVYDKESNSVNTDNLGDKNAEDLVGVAVRQTLLNGGRVYLLEQEQMPGSHQLAAIFRY